MWLKQTSIFMKIIVVFICSALPPPNPNWPQPPPQAPQPPPTSQPTPQPTVTNCDESLSGNGADYDGCQSVTISGETCKKWSEQDNMHDKWSDPGVGDHNYCRNPDDIYRTIGCFTRVAEDDDCGGSGNDYLTRWQYCLPIPRCDESLNVSINGTDYDGCQSRTVSGKVCQKWTPENYPHASGADEYDHGYDHNYCRNSNSNSDGKATIWCFTSDSEWEFCSSLTTMIGTDEEYGEHFAPLLLFDSNAEGFPTIYDYPNGNELSQNVDSDISSIPTYYHVFRDEYGRVSSIGYYWYYAYQTECIVDDIDVSIDAAVDDEIEGIIVDVMTLTGQDLGDHNNDRERIFVNLHEDGVTLESVTYHQHNGHYTVPNYWWELDVSNVGDSVITLMPFQMHPYVYIGRTSHGSYHKNEAGVGGCGYFADYRDGAIQGQSWMNLHDAVSADPDWIVDQPQQASECDPDTPACDWKKCSSSSDLYNNAQLCTPLMCERLDTGCIPFGASDAVEASIKGMEETNNLYWVFKDISDPDCDPYPWAGESIHFTFCYPDL